MVRVGYFLSSEQFSPAELVDQARRAERAGFDALWISDHFHPWIDAQGHSPFVWSVIGALSQVTRLPVTTAVTCPTMRMHPAIVAHAAATSAVLHEGRFTLGVGTGENLNEHVLGDRWPPVEERLDMLEEAVEVMRLLWGGGVVDHEGEHYSVRNARLYDVPAQPPAVYVSGFGPKAVRLAARIGDGYVTTTPDAELVRLFRESGGGDKPVQAGTKVSWDRDEQRAVEAVHRLWPNEALPGQLAQELETPAFFEQASSLVTPDMVAESTVCGDDVDRHVQELRRYVDAGVDEVYVQQVGPDLDEIGRAHV
jgi:G6PDH family F420-dependent oxidoreductase